MKIIWKAPDIGEKEFDSQQHKQHRRSQALALPIYNGKGSSQFRIGSR
jgi:hypothetical protein